MKGTGKMVVLVVAGGTGLIALFIGNNPLGTPSENNNPQPQERIEIYEEPRQEEPAPLITELPESNLEYIPTQVHGNALIQHDHYTVSYSRKHQNPEWVVYTLTAEQISQGGQAKRTSFKADPKYSYAAHSRMYNRSGYDRGHLVPASDQGFSDEAMAETFYMTNVVPQVPEFNRGIWKELEAKVRSWATTERRLYVVTGPLLRNNIDEAERIGETGPTIPRGFYKIILDYDGSYKKGIAFMFKNKAIDQPIEKFATTIDLVEDYTGIDFFPMLTEEEEQALEAVSSVHLWDFE